MPRVIIAICVVFLGIGLSCLLVSCSHTASGSASVDDPATFEPWTFVSMPDFLNVDTNYPQPGWEETLDFVLDAVEAENPDFVLVPGDLVTGAWWSEAKIEKYAAVYYAEWVARMRAHGLEFYAAVGDHEVGDNPWPPERAKLVPSFKRAFREQLKMPLNGPEKMKGTAFYFEHKNTLFVAVDVFEESMSKHGGIVTQVTGEQLEWFEDTLENHPHAEHVIVMGHTPVLGPVRRESSSGLMTEGGRRSDFWRSMARHYVDLYLCGEMHAITCTERDGVQQVVHGGLFGYNTKVNYLVARVSPRKIELELKELDIINGQPRLWQEGLNRPAASVSVSEEIRNRGYVSVGRMVLNKTWWTKRTRDKTGYFDERDNPK